jgi:hypothetical protein
MAEERAAKLEALGFAWELSKQHAAIAARAQLDDSSPAIIDEMVECLRHLHATYRDGGARFGGWAAPAGARVTGRIIASTAVRCGAVRCGRKGRRKQAAAPAVGNSFAAGRMDGAVTPRVKSERQERVPSAPVYGIQSVPCASKPAGVQNRRPRRSIHMF